MPETAVIFFKDDNGNHFEPTDITSLTTGISGGVRMKPTFVVFIESCKKPSN